MRIFRPRALAASMAFLALLGLSAGSAFADRIVETVYGVPASYYVPTGYVATSAYVPSSYSYVVPSSYSYVAPTSYSYVAPSSYSYVTPSSYSYVLPASYSTTAYSYLPTSYSYAVTPTYYATTYYRRPGLLRRLAARPVYETSRTYAYDVYPTSFLSPSTITYDAPLVATSLGYATGCVESGIQFNPPPPAAAGNGNGGADATSKSITSKPRDSGEPTYKDQPDDKSKDQGKAKDAGDAVAPDKDAGGAGNLNVPADAPPTIKGNGTQDRTSFRFPATELRPRAGSSSQPMLHGEILSGMTGQAKANLEVVFTDLKGTYPDRTKKTDSKGTFEIFLPNGSWSMRVIDPSAPAGTKAMEYGQITATAGRYLDGDDAPIYSLRLSH